MRLPPRAAVVVIGDEILGGEVADVNGPFLLEALAARGVEVVELRQVGDRVAAIAQAVADLGRGADQIIACGGVGPTHDDVTMAGIARALGRDLVEHPDLLAFFGGDDGAADAGALAARLKMARVPRGARVHRAPPAAPPFVPVVEVEGIFVLPGVPSLLSAAFRGVEVWGRGPRLARATLSLACRESEVALVLEAVQHLFADVQIGSYPQAGQAPSLKVACRGRDAERVAAARRALVERLPPALRLAAEP